MNARKLWKQLFVEVSKGTWLLVIGSYLFVFIVLQNEIKAWYSYIAYGLSAYSLVVTVIFVIKHLKPLVLRLLESFEWGRRYLHETLFRLKFHIAKGFFINLLFAVIKLFYGFSYQAIWYMALGIYNLLLAVMRLLLLQEVRLHPNEKEYLTELKRYQLCGWMLLGVNMVLSLIAGLAVRHRYSFEYAGNLIYLMALYAFYVLPTSIVHMVTYRKYHSPALNASTMISLTSALVTMLALETAMLATFNGKEDESFRMAMVSITGFVICVTVLLLSIFMIRKSNQETKCEVVLYE